MENQITKIEIRFQDGAYRVYVTKRFAEEYGGGESTICLDDAPTILHNALRVAASAATVSSTYRAHFEMCGARV